MNILHVISRWLKTKGDYGRVLINLAVGIGLISLAGVANTPDGILFAQSPWILPSVALSFFLGKLIQQVLTYRCVMVWQILITCSIVMLLTYSKVVARLGTVPR